VSGVATRTAARGGKTKSAKASTAKAARAAAKRSKPVPKSAAKGASTPRKAAKGIKTVRKAAKGIKAVRRAAVKGIKTVRNAAAQGGAARTPKGKTAKVGAAAPRRVVKKPTVHMPEPMQVQAPVVEVVLPKAHKPHAVTPGVPSWERHVRKLPVPFPLREFDLESMSDADLEACSKALGIRLSLSEMKDAREYFRGKGRNPTDVEMEALGQAWSEHCCYKSSKPVLKRNVYGIAEGKIICREDAGVLPFDGDWYYSPKLESHNHPSAVEPYGGAATGIGGVIRDVVCMGAQPVALVDPLFFGPLDTPSLPAGVKHPRFLLSGVIEGIRDYGNRVGIPTVAGGITFHPGYTGNCLVNVGCVGVLHKSQLTHSRAGGVGDIFVYLGNATGRDGIHGVAFASEELSEASEEASRSAVQVGDAILKEPLIHATLEIIAEGLATGCKDFGGGGLSCVAGELAYDAGYGCAIELEKVPLKVPNMAPWEIWVSESQERMMVTAKPKDVARILEIAKKWDVPAVAVGKVIQEPVNRVTYNGERVLEFDLKFSTGGPVYARTAQERIINRENWLDFQAPADLNEVLLSLMAHPNVMSKEWVVRQYDHEVRANTVLKPLQGVIGSEGPGDATVLKPVRESDKGMAIASDVNPNYTSRDPYWGAASAVDEVVRNLAAVGARIDSFCDNLNFGNPEKPDRMWELEESARGLGDMARVLDVPFASGNVSLYNEGPSGPIPPTPTVMGVGILSHYKHATTMDLKAPGNLLFLFGKTHRELGGGLYLEHLGLEGERVPQSNARFLKACADSLVGAIEKGLVRSAHDCSEGGIGVALAEMAFAGRLGASVDLAQVAPGLRSDMKLFSESNSRWILEVEPGKEAELWLHLGQGAPLFRLGQVTQESRVVVTDGQAKLLDVAASECRDAWSLAMPRLMGIIENPEEAPPEAVEEATPAPGTKAAKEGKSKKAKQAAKATKSASKKPKTATAAAKKAKAVGKKAKAASKTAKPAKAAVKKTKAVAKKAKAASKAKPAKAVSRKAKPTTAAPKPVKAVSESKAKAAKAASKKAKRTAASNMKGKPAKPTRAPRVAQKGAARKGKPVAGSKATGSKAVAAAASSKKTVTNAAAKAERPAKASKSKATKANAKATKTKAARTIAKATKTKASKSAPPAKVKPTKPKSGPKGGR
jgi:phosphoribosylformylglycinamidine synthase subunit PurL